MIKSINCKRNAFTMVEVLVGAVIVTIFMGAVFSLYSMGTNMFSSGSWKYARQKDAEYFLNMMKERIEQCARVTKVDPTDENNSITECPTNFICLASGSKVLSPTQKDNVKNIAEFYVCKPDLTNVPGADLNKRKGLVVFHSIVLMGNSESERSGVGDLHMKADWNADDNNFFGASFQSGRLTFSGMDAQDFIRKNEPSIASVYGLAPVPKDFILRDVAAVTVECGYAEEKGIDNKIEETPVFGIVVEMQNPKHKGTTLVMSRKARIDNAVKLVTKEGN